MAFCEKCGTKVEEGTKFCPSCGGEIRNVQNNQTSSNPVIENKITETFNNFNNTADNTAEFTSADIEQNKIMGVLSYLSWLVLIPVFVAKDSKYARFHANQGLTLAIAEIIWVVADGIISTVLWTIFASKMWGIYKLLTTALDLVYWVFVVVAILGLVNALNGKAKELPVIGKIKILK